MNYDFMTLSPEDFENLVRDLLSAEWGAQLESFKTGADDGIDLRHSRIELGQKVTIVQCKRYSPKSVSRLMRAMKSERVKIQRLNPARYVLVTSVGLSPKNKEALRVTLEPWVSTSGDIYGASELNGLLNKHPAVLRSHFKLWISSTTVLERVLHAHIFNITEHTVSEIRREMGKLVVHAGFYEALQKLEKYHHVMIVGNAGIGKTTLARMLLSHYLEAGFRPIVASQDIAEAWKLSTAALQAKERVVIYYDDFLGRTSFASKKFEKNEDSRLLSLFDRVRASKNLRLILTTREYILADARLQHSAFDERADEILKLAISVEHYSKDVQARILFNHLYFSRIPLPFLRRLIRDHSYRKIIGSEHFNPRVVEKISSLTSRDANEPEEFVSKAVSAFSDPSTLWAKLYDSEIPVSAQQLLVLLWTFDGEAVYEELLDGYLKLNSPTKPEAAQREFDEALKVLDGNFVSTLCVPLKLDQANSPVHKAIFVQFQNPSIEDLVQSRICDANSVWPGRLLTAIVSWRQIRFLSWMVRDKGPLDSSKSVRLVLSPSQLDLLGSATLSLIDAREGRLHRWFDGRIEFECHEAIAYANRFRTILELGKKGSSSLYDFALHRLRTQSEWAKIFATVDEHTLVATDVKRLFVSLDEIYAESRLTEHIFEAVIDAFQACLLDKLAHSYDELPDFSISTWADLCWIFEKWEISTELGALIELRVVEFTETVGAEEQDPDEIESNARHAEFLADALNAPRLSCYARDERSRATEIRDNEEKLEDTSDNRPARKVEKLNENYDELFELLLDK